MHVGSAQGMDRNGRPMAAASRQRRPFADDILIAFHYACDLRDYMVAGQLLLTYESMLTGRSGSPTSDRRRALDSLVAAHERLWSLRHASPGN